MRYYQAIRHAGGRTDEKFLQFACALFIAPVADPNHVNFLLAAQRLELVNVGRLVEGPDAGNAEAVGIDAANRLAKGEHTIHQMKMELQDLSGVRVRAMMAVMKQRDEAQLLLERKHAVYNAGIIPFVEQYQLCFLQLVFQKLRKLRISRLVETNIELRIETVKGVHCLNPAVAFVLHQISQRPGAHFLIAAHLAPP